MSERVQKATQLLQQSTGQPFDEAAMMVAGAQVQATLAVAEEIRALRVVLQGATRIIRPTPTEEGPDAGVWPRGLVLDTVLVDPRGVAS